MKRGNAIAGLGAAGSGGLIDAETKLKIARDVLANATKDMDQKQQVPHVHLSSNGRMR